MLEMVARRIQPQASEHDSRKRSNPREMMQPNPVRAFDAKRQKPAAAKDQPTAGNPS
jgi:hypothetical protein